MMRVIVKSAFIALLISIIVISITILVQGHSATVDYLLELCKNLGIRLDVPNILSSTAFVGLQLTLLTSVIGLVYLIFFKFEFLYHYIRQFFVCIFGAFRNLWFDVANKQALIVLAIPFAASIYFGLTVPISYDEVITYLTFTKEPFYYSMVYYPFPNNHVFHSLLTNVTEHLPFFDMLFRIRIPTIIVSLFTWLIAYSFLKKYYSEKVAIFVVAISAILFRSIYYSFLSRGYGMVVLFFVIALYAAYNIIYRGNKKKDWMFFVISGVLGCYAVPSFLYPFATINLLILIYNYKNIKKQIIYNIVAGVSILAAYTPIFFVDGFKALANNQFVVSEGKTRIDILAELPSFFYEGLKNLFGISSLVVLILMFVALIWTIKNKDKNKLILWAVFCITPFILLLLHNVIPFHRTFIYHTFAFVFLIGISFEDVINKVSKVWLIIVVVLIQVAGVANFKLNIGEDETFNTYSNDVTDKILERGKTYMVNYSHILFNIETEGYDANNFVINERYDISWANADTINNVDYIVISKNIDTTKEKKPFYSNKDFNVYKK